MQIGAVGACFLIGIAIGCCTLARLSDIYGRKPIYLIGMVTMLICYFILIFLTNATFCYILLVVIGIATSGK
jgi:MFS family permease